MAKTKRLTKLPEKIRTAPPTVKIVFLALTGRGWVRFSRLEVSEALGISHPSTVHALEYLHAHGHLVYESEKSPYSRSTYKVSWNATTG